MAHAIDDEAAKQIERLFHASDCRVWDVVDAPVIPRAGDLPIARADGALVGFARPAGPPEECWLPVGPVPYLDEPAWRPIRAVLAPRVPSLAPALAIILLGLLLSLQLLQSWTVHAFVPTPAATGSVVTSSMTSSAICLAVCPDDGLPATLVDSDGTEVVQKHAEVDQSAKQSAKPRQWTKPQQPSQIPAAGGADRRQSR